MTGCRVILECTSVKGFCPFYHEGDKISFEEPGIVMEETDAICFAAILTFAPFYRPLIRGISPEEMGLTQRLITCHAAPLNRPDSHGTVFFEIHQIPVDETIEDKWMDDLSKQGIRGENEVIKRKYWPDQPTTP
jgi:uncharacterized repeat protein (TIGR04076 family)